MWLSLEASSNTSTYQRWEIRQRPSASARGLGVSLYNPRLRVVGTFAADSVHLRDDFLSLHNVHNSELYRTINCYYAMLRSFCSSSSKASTKSIFLCITQSQEPIAASARLRYARPRATATFRDRLTSSLWLAGVKGPGGLAGLGSASSAGRQADWH